MVQRPAKRRCFSANYITVLNLIYGDKSLPFALLKYSNDSVPNRLPKLFICLVCGEISNICIPVQYVVKTRQCIICHQNSDSIMKKCHSLVFNERSFILK